MAKVIKNRNCVMCGQPNVQLWTLDNMQGAAVAYLCLEHSAPLLAVMEAAGDLAPDDQTPLTERSGEPVPRAYRARRGGEMAPLLNWTPPEELAAMLKPKRKRRSKSRDGDGDTALSLPPGSDLPAEA